MRTAVLGSFVVAVAVLVLAAVAAGPERSDPAAPGVRPVQASIAKDMVALSVTVGDKYQQVTVIDPKLQVMSVYHIEPRHRENRPAKRSEHPLGLADDGVQQREPLAAGDSSVDRGEVTGTPWSKNGSTRLKRWLPDWAFLRGKSTCGAERNELRAYRDGANWKFKVEEVDALAKELRSQAKPAGNARRRQRRRALERAFARRVGVRHLGHGDRPQEFGRRRDIRLAGSSVDLADGSRKPGASRQRAGNDPRRGLVAGRQRGLAR